MFTFYKIAGKFAPGSYPYAERYEIKASEKSLIQATNKFKAKHPDIVPADSIGLVDGRSASPDDYWYHVYFYYPKEDQLLTTWIRASDKTHSTFAFTAVSQGTGLGKWRLINKDLDSNENRLQKHQFEQRILKEITKNLE
ncbi:hypothetical protein Slin_3196 [Spirosoma linguale DSM 74]|uniref:Uncharacterized protein n=2 Tax=Spirosoma TaxID=107 RepID=D2QME4_SPILD|nr:hypothetical protein Slin_3196 [Spirosoma linguale DSM 74]